MPDCDEYCGRFDCSRIINLNLTIKSIDIKYYYIKRGVKMYETA